jgi:FkbM family methyltransferase
VSLSRGFSNVSAHNFAVGDCCCAIEFRMQTNRAYNRGLSSVLHNDDLADGFETIKVKMVSLDDFLDDSTKSRVAVIKIDVQGYESQVIFGARETIKSSKPIIIFEFESNYHRGDAEGVFKNIRQKLSNYKVFLIKKGECEFFWEFEMKEVCKEGFEGNFICFPVDYFDFEDSAVQVKIQPSHR